MPYFAISVLFQVALVVHIIKTGRNIIWIFVVVLLPVAGTLAYLIIEVVPELLGGQTGRRLQKDISNIVNPNKELNSALKHYTLADTVENAIKLAEECISKGMYEEAKTLYEKSLKGIHEDDPHLIYGLARAEFGLKDYRKVKELLDSLIQKNPEYKNVDAHLLYAKATEESGDIDLALEEYEVLDSYYPGAEATYRFAVLLSNNGDPHKSKELFEKILHLSKTSGKLYNMQNQKWISLAKSNYHS